MAKGRKQVPENIKIVRGTFRDDRANKNAPVPDSELPRSPSWLPAEAREYFGILKERLDSVGLASKTHTEMLAMAAQRLSEIDVLNDIITKDGPVYESEKYSKDGQLLSRMSKSNPAVGQRSEAMRHLQSLLAEFGLSPASVNKVSVLSKGGKKKTGFGGL